MVVYLMCIGVLTCTTTTLLIQIYFAKNQCCEILFIFLFGIAFNKLTKYTLAAEILDPRILR